ncbi:hypothetical protein [Runella sp.]|uniref:dioxygenase family protein n=1 Tax=Runella sp. TaxID=1960881 RepID=UPI003D121C5D
MKSGVISYLTIWAMCLPHFCQSQQWSIKIKTLSAQLTAHPTRSGYDSLHFIMTEHYQQLTTDERTKVRAILEKQAKWTNEILCTNNEKGTKITIKGRLLDEHQKPIPNAKLYIFHADSKGYYAPTDSALKRMNEAEPRLFGFLTTDQSGNYSFQTIRPASYPGKYNGRTIPQHIHINSTATGYQSRNIQMVFDDDSAMKDAHWRDWAKQQNYPVVKLLFEKDKGLYGICDIVLNQ